MDWPYKVLIIAVVALTLIYFFLAYFAPYYLWPQDPVGAIKQQLTKAELSLGKSQTTTFLFTNDFSTSVSIFENNSRSVAFNCNDLIHCCDKGLSGKGCNNKIVWDERKILFDSTLQTTVTTRCFEEELYVCKVFIGKKPAQLDANSKYDKLLDLSKNSKFSPVISVKNIGDIETQDIIIEGSLFEVNSDGSKHLVDEDKILMMPLLAKGYLDKSGKYLDINFFQINFEPKKSGKYVGELHIYDSSDLTDFINLNLEFEAINAHIILLCKPIAESVDFDIVSEHCIVKYLCENCDFAFDCKEVWEKSTGKTLNAGDRTYAYGFSEEIEGCMPEDPKVDIAILESTVTVDQAQDVSNVILQNNYSTNWEKITKVALELQNRYSTLPYIWGGKQLPPGVDCSGFVYNVFKIVGISNKVENALGYSSHGGTVVFDKENFYNKSAPNKYVNGVLQPGDVLFFDLSDRVGRGVKGIDHTAIYIGNEQLVHSGNGGIKIKPLKNYAKSLMVARRY